VGNPKTVKLEPAAWDAEAAWHLAQLCEDAPGGVQAVGLEVQEGRALLWAVIEDGDRCGSVVSRVATMLDGSADFVIEHAYARASIDLTRKVLPVIEVTAWAMGCRRVRVHTTRHGLSAKLEQMGYGLPEMVLVKDRPDGL